MSTNTNKRISVKWVRDKAKAAYDKKDRCFICESTTDLELHHTSSLTLLLEKWSKENNIDISTDEAIISVRDRFIDAHHGHIYDEVFTLCLVHHQKLHGIFGKAPPLGTSQKQIRWIEKQKAKALGLDDGPKVGSFAKFY